MTFPITTTLDGTWQLRPTDTFRQGFYPLDDPSWLEQDLPAHWQQHPLLESYAGRVVYRKRFAAQRMAMGDGDWRTILLPLSLIPHPPSLATGSVSTAHSTGRNRTSMVWILAGTKATSLRRSMRSQPGGRREHTAGRGRLPRGARQARQTHDHRRILALGLPRPGHQPGRDLAAGRADRHWPDPHQTAAAAHPNDRRRHCRTALPSGARCRQRRRCHAALDADAQELRRSDPADRAAPRIGRRSAGVGRRCSMCATRSCGGRTTWAIPAATRSRWRCCTLG